MPKDLSNREYLRTNEVTEVFGLRDGYINNLLLKDESFRACVRHLPGERGVRLFNVAKLRRWIEKQELLTK